MSGVFEALVMRSWSGGPDAGLCKEAAEEIERLKAALAKAEGERDKLIDLVVQPFRGKWETSNGPRQVGVYPTREQAVAAFRKAAGLGEGE